MGKRLKGEGSHAKRPDGRYQYSVMVNGQRQYLYGKTQEEIVAKADALRAAVKEGKLIKKTNVTVAEWLGEWLDRYCRDIKRSTWELYETMIRLHITPVLGEHRLSKLTHSQVQNAMNELTKLGRSPRVVDLSLSILASALRAAKKEKYLAENPADGVTTPRNVTKIKRLFTDDEAAKMLTEIKKSKSVFADAAIVAWESMCRISEVLGLKWDYVESDGFRVEEALSRVGSKSEDSSPKNEASRRKVYLPESSMARINKQKKIGPYVFHTADGKYLRYRNFLREWSVWLARAFGSVPVETKGGEPERREKYPKPLLVVTPHAMRHAAATRLIEAGWTIADVQERGGWKTGNMIVKIYARHSSRERQKKMAEQSSVEPAPAAPEAPSSVSEGAKMPPNDTE